MLRKIMQLDIAMISSRKERIDFSRIGSDLCKKMFVKELNGYIIVYTLNRWANQPSARL